MQPEIISYHLSLNDLQIEINQIEEAMGYEPENVPDVIHELAEKLLIESNELIDIKGSICHSDQFSIDKAMGEVSFNHLIFEVGKKIANQLSGAKTGLFFLCTIGNNIEKKSRELSLSGDFLEGYIFDVIGSVVVEAAINKIVSIIEVDFKMSGENLTNRYCPGYCGWKLEEQIKILSLFKDNYCNITLSDSFLMSPVKSVSGLIGVGKNMKKGLHECQLCELTTCQYRKKRLEKIASINESQT